MYINVHNLQRLVCISFLTVLHGNSMEPEDAYTSLSEYHDYEPRLEFDDSELIQASGLGKLLDI